MAHGPLVYDFYDNFQVSPQFRGAPSGTAGHGRRRITRQRRHSLGGTLATASNTNKENTHCGSLEIAGHRKLLKYKSLKFVGDQTTVASLAEEVDISCDTETTDEDVQNQHRISDLETSCDDDLDRRSSTNLKLGRKGHQIVLSEVSKGNNNHDHISTSPNVELCNDLDTHRSRSKGHRTGGLDGDLGNSDVQPCETDSPKGATENEVQYNTNKRKHLNHRKKAKLKNLRKSIFNLSALSTDSDSPISGPELPHQHNDNTEGTQRRYHVSVKSPVKRLFTSQLQVTSPALIERRNSVFPTAAHSDNSSLTSLANSDDSTSNQHTPVRRSKRIAANLKRLATDGTPVRNTLALMEVLVADTPESDKGLTIRQKQLKGIL